MPVRAWPISVRAHAGGGHGGQSQRHPAGDGQCAGVCSRPGRASLVCGVGPGPGHRWRGASGCAGITTAVCHAGGGGHRTRSDLSDPASHAGRRDRQPGFVAERVSAWHAAGGVEFPASQSHHRRALPGHGGGGGESAIRLTHHGRPGLGARHWPPGRPAPTAWRPVCGKWIPASAWYRCHGPNLPAPPLSIP